MGMKLIELMVYHPNFIVDHSQSAHQPINEIDSVPSHYASEKNIALPVDISHYAYGVFTIPCSPFDIQCENKIAFS